MGIKKDRGVYYNSAAILEYRSKPEPAVRLLFSEPNETDPNNRKIEVETMPFCNKKDWCSLDTFKDGVKDQTFDDWKKTCQYPVCFCTPASKQAGK